MNKKFYSLTALLLGVFFLLTTKAFSQGGQHKLYNFYNPDSTWISSNCFNHVAENGFFISAGGMQSPSITPMNCYIAKFDYQFNLLQKRYLYFPGALNAFSGKASLINITKNKYLVSASDVDTQINSRISVNQPFFYFFDANLDSIRFVKLIDTVRSRYPFAIAQDQQKNILACGQISSANLTYNSWAKQYGYDSVAIWIAKLDSNANLLWEKQLLTMSLLNYQTCSSSKIIASNDGHSYLITGLYSDAAINNWPRLCIIKTDTSGNVLWQKPLPSGGLTNSNQADIDIINLKNGGYAFSSVYSDSYNATVGKREDFFFYYGKLDENGDTLWTGKFKRYGGDSWGLKVQEAMNGDLIVLGAIYHDGYPHPTLLRIDSNGKSKWYREYLYRKEGRVSQDLWNVSELSDKRLLLSGGLGCSYKIPGVFDTAGALSWYILTDTMGCINPGCQSIDSIFTPPPPILVQYLNNTMGRISVYPNPSKDVFYVHAEVAGGCEVTVTDVTGRQLQTAAIPGGNSTIPLDASGWAQGVYLYSIKQNGVLLQSGRLIRN